VLESQQAPAALDVNPAWAARSPVRGRQVSVEYVGQRRISFDEGAVPIGNGFNGIKESKADRLLGKSAPDSYDFKDNVMVSEKAAIFSSDRLKRLNKEAAAAERIGEKLLAEDQGLANANRWRGAGEFFSARFSGAASAWGGVRSGVSARLDAAADVAAGVYASYKVKAGMKSASEAAAAAALRSQGLRRAADVEAFAAGDNYDPSILRRLLDDADLGPGMRKAIKDDYAEGKVKFLDDVSRLKSAAPDQRDAMARGMVDTYIRDLDVINLEAGYLEKFAKKFDDAGQQYSTGMFDVPEGQVAGLLKASASSSMTKFGKFRLSAATKDMAASLAEQRFSMLRSPLDRLAAASPMVRSKSAQNALSAGYFDNQAAARAAEFARFNIENASSPGDQFYAAWDNPQLQKSVRDASSVGGKFQDETYVFALATRDYQRARLAGNAQGVTDALDKLSERITQRVSTPYAGGGFDDLNAPEEVLAVNMNQKADELFNRAIHNREYDVLDRTLPVAVNKLLAADSIRQADRFTNFGKFLNNNGLSGANLPNNPEVAEVNKLLGIFGS
jgi:hypothetical protein